MLRIEYVFMLLLLSFLKLFTIGTQVEKSIFLFNEEKKIHDIPPYFSGFSIDPKKRLIHE